MSNEINNTIDTSQTFTQETVASTGNQSHTQTTGGQPVVNTTDQTSTTTTAGTGYQPGPDQVLADYRRRAEEAESRAKEFESRLTDPAVAQFLEFQKAQKEKEAADKLGATPELLHEFNTLKQTQEEMLAAQELQSAKAGFSSFAESQKMPEAVQTEFLGYLEKVLPPEFQQLALKPGFNFEPYVHGFAAARGASQVQSQEANANKVTFVPGQPSSSAGNSKAMDMKEYILNRVKQG